MSVPEGTGRNSGASIFWDPCWTQAALSIWDGWKWVGTRKFVHVPATAKEIWSGRTRSFAVLILMLVRIDGHFPVVIKVDVSLSVAQGSDSLIRGCGSTGTRERTAPWQQAGGNEKLRLAWPDKLGARKSVCFHGRSCTAGGNGAVYGLQVGFIWTVLSCLTPKPPQQSPQFTV